MTREVVITDRSTRNVAPQNPIRIFCILVESLIWCWSFTLFFIAMQTHSMNMWGEPWVRCSQKQKPSPECLDTDERTEACEVRLCQLELFHNDTGFTGEAGQELSWSLSSQGATTDNLFWQHKIVSRILHRLQDCGQMMGTGTNSA